MSRSMDTGHLTGTRLLEKLAQRVALPLREYDMMV